MRPGLESLFAPRSVAEVVASVASDEPCVVHGVREGIAPLLAIPRLASLDALLAAWPAPVDAHLPDVADEASAVSVSPPDARKLFATGMGLLFNEAQAYEPALVPWLDAIRAELGLSALTQQRCLVYATPAGGGTAPHFDQNVNFVVQVHGTKTWTLAANTHVARPLTRHTMGLPADGELAGYASLPLPSAMPAARREIVLEPGSVLFVPRGMWHATQAQAEALALNFTFSPPTWIDLLTAALRGRLAQSSAWRATATPHDVAAFEALLRALADDVPAWTAADILAATEG